MHSPALHTHTRRLRAHTQSQLWPTHNEVYALALSEKNTKIQLFVFFTSLHFFVLLFLIWFFLKLCLNVAIDTFLLLLLGSETHTQLFCILANISDFHNANKLIFFVKCRQEIKYLFFMKYIHIHCTISWAPIEPRTRRERRRRFCCFRDVRRRQQHDA